jgi:hypothetical protein
MQWHGECWEELGGSSSYGGISDSKVQSYQPIVAINKMGNPIVAWSENYPLGEYLNNFNFKSEKPTSGNEPNIYVKQWIGKEELR